MPYRSARRIPPELQRSVLIDHTGQKRFVTLDEAARCRALPGCKNFREHAYTDGAGEYLFAADPRAQTGYRVSLYGVDVSGCPRAPMVNSFRSAEASAYFQQLQAARLLLPQTVRARIDIEAYAIFHHAAELCTGESLPELEMPNEFIAALSPGSRSQLRDGQEPRRHFECLADVTEEALIVIRAGRANKRIATGDPARYLAECEAECERALRQLPIMLEYHLQDTEARIKTRVMNSEAWNWRKIVRAWLFAAKMQLGL